MPLSWNEIRNRSVTFVREWEGESSENAEAKTFWDGFFNIFGVSRRRLASFEKHVKKADGKDGFIDLFWPGVLLAEHKSLGKNLDSAYNQATDYFPGLSDKELPRYIIVSDFANIRVKNLDTGEITDLLLEELPNSLTLFGFIAGYETREYREQDPVNIKAAQKLSELHDALKSIGYEGHELEVYLVRILFCLFAEDTGIFMPRSAFEDFIRVRTAEDGSDLAPRLNQIFQTLNTPEDKRLQNLDEQVASLPYVNGDLFSEFLPQASFDSSMRAILLECCELDWGAISPAIFGSLFQGIMDTEIRRNLGAHYTSEKNIQKVIGPLFIDELWAEYSRIKTQKSKLQAFHNKIGSLNFFDPACGCGNFLVISYRELRLLELQVIKQLYTKEQQQLSMDAIDQYVKVDVDQFHGIEIEEWPAQIARVAMWLIDHQMNLQVGKTFGQALVRIPLIKSANIVNGNALTVQWDSIIDSKKCSYVYGNPPFLGHHYQDAEQKNNQASVMHMIKGNGVLDFVSNWYVKASQYIQDNNEIKCSFVSTNSITQGEQVGLLWSYLYRMGIIINFAHRTFQWNNEASGVASVHCVIIGFSLKENRKKTIFDYASLRGEPTAKSASNINAYIVDGPNIVISNSRQPICDVPKMSWGNKPTDGGNLILSPEERIELIQLEPSVEIYIRRYMGGGDFLNNIERYCLWLKDVDSTKFRTMPKIMKRVESVKNFRLESKAKATRDYAQFPTLFRQISQPETDYLAVPEVSSERRTYIPIAFLSKDVICSNTIQFVPNATYYHFGILSSTMHMAWMRTVAGRLKSDYRYSNTIVYNNFPWPIDISEEHIELISDASLELLNIRDDFPDSTLADLYDPLSMPPALVKSHRALDKAVDKAYSRINGKRKWNTETERVAFLLDLHQEITTLLPRKKKIIAHKISKK